jgi:hypothetical protein
MVKPKASTERNVKDVDAIAGPNPMDRFRELAKKLVNVPRSELEIKTRRAVKLSRHEGEKPK